ncbi:MAG: acetamidase/formamidase family protein [Planctomycetes bacterium]|nr:acetamidase/formamidase family protein [Planctomycetota bacterium]
MKRVSREKLYHVISALNEPSAVVEQSEHFVVETEAGRGEQCIRVEGAVAGEVLAVEILNIVPEPDGYTANGPGCKSFPDWIRYRGWGQIRRDVKLANGEVAWPGGFSFPWAPMVGMLGTAPEPPEAPTTGFQGIYGGNMDCPLLTAGSTLYVPVLVDGAFLHIGDVHAVQGDGEICGAGGIECRAEVTLSVRSIPRPKGFSWPRIEKSDTISTVGIGGSMDHAYRIAVEALLRWIQAETSWPEEEVFLLLGSVLEARLCELVNPNVAFVATFPRAYLEMMRPCPPPPR